MIKERSGSSLDKKWGVAHRGPRSKRGLINNGGLEGGFFDTWPLSTLIIMHQEGGSVIREEGDGIGGGGIVEIYTFKQMPIN